MSHRPTTRPRLAVVLSHPIQHFCPQYASWAKLPDLDLCVFFASSAGLNSYHDPNFGTDVKWQGIDLSAFPHVFLGDGSARPIDKTLDAPGLDDQLARFDPDAVLIYGYWMPFYRRAQAWASRHGKAMLYFSDAEPRYPEPLTKRLAKRIVLPRLFRRFDLFATTGDANEEHYRTHGVPMERMVRMPYPIDARSYDDALTQREGLRQSRRAALGLADDEFVVSMVGKFVPWKRQQDLVRMLDHLADLPRRVTVLLIGTGVDEPELRRLAEAQKRHRVLFSGFVQPVDLPSYYAASDLYAHVSASEPHSVAVSEAVYMGLPVVISDRCGSYGPTDDVQVGRNGFVYPCGDTQALAAVVRRLATDPDLSASLGAASTAHGVRAQTLSHRDGLPAALRLAGVLGEAGTPLHANGELMRSSEQART